MKLSNNKSLIFSYLTKFSNYIYDKLPIGFFANLLTKKSDHENSFFVRLKYKINLKNRISIPMKRFFAKCFDKSVLLEKTRSFASQAPFLPLKTIGLFLFSFGFLTSLTYIIKSGGISFDYTAKEFLFTSVVAVMGAIFSLSQKNFYEAICESKIMSFVLFNFFGLKQTSQKYQLDNKANSLFGLIAGIAAGFFAIFFAPQSIMIALLSIILCYAVMCFPESGAVAVFAFLPLLSSSGISFICILTFVSYLVKLIRGKRTLKLTFTDICVIFFGICLYLGNRFSVSSEGTSQTSVLLISLLTAYFTVTNTIKTGAWLNRCIKALIISFSFVLISGFAGYLISGSSIKEIEIINELIPNSLIQAYSFNSLLIIMSVALLPMCIMSFIRSEGETVKTAYLLTIICSFSCIIISNSIGALVSCIVCIIIYALLNSRKSLPPVVLGLVTIPLIILLLPSSWVGEIKSFFGVDRILSAQLADNVSTTSKIISDAFLCGIGLNDGAFEKVYPLYSSSPIGTNTYSHSLYTQLCVSVGFTGLLIFIIMILSLIKSFFSYYSKSSGDNEYYRGISLTSFIGIFSLLILGITDYIFNSPLVFTLFFLMCALLKCSSEIAASERTHLVIDGPYIDIRYKSGNKYN